MPASITKIGIINRGLQLLGQRAITSLSENSVGAREMLRAYDSIVLSELEDNVWKFSVKRASLPADAVVPQFGKKHSFAVPVGFLYLAPNETTYQEPDRRDWEIEGLSIFTDDDAPLNIRYVSSDIPESQYSPLFAEALATRLAIATCEVITNSNTKLQNLGSLYSDTVSRAKKRNALQKPPSKAPIQSWISVRS